MPQKKEKGSCMVEWGVWPLKSLLLLPSKVRNVRIKEKASGIHLGIMLSFHFLQHYLKIQASLLNIKGYASP